MATTQYQPHGLPGGRYSFVAKEPEGFTPHNPGTITQHSPLGMWMMRYGSFAGKETEGGAGGGTRPRRTKYWHRNQ
jgi:hypothetical protein